LRRAGIGQSRRGSGDQRELRRRFGRLFHPDAHPNTQREPDSVALTDEQRNAHPSADAHIHGHPITHGVAHAYRDAWSHTRRYGTQSQGADPDVSLHL